MCRILTLPALFTLALAFLITGCAARPEARPFTSPQQPKLLPGMPFYPDDTNLCGPASLAALLTYNGFPTTVEEATEGVQRWNLRGSIGADLVIYARLRGAEATFFSSSPEELLEYVDRGRPVLVEVDNGIGPVVSAHFMVVVGYTHDGVVANNGLVQQEIIPWSKFLTAWFRMGYFAMVVNATVPEPAAPEPAAPEPGAEGTLPAEEGAG